MPVFFPFSVGIVPANARRIREDFHSIDNTIMRHWANNTAGTATLAGVADSSGAALGRFQLSVTSAGTGTARTRPSEACWIALPPFFQLWQCDFTPSNLSDGTNRYYAQLGFTDNGAASQLPSYGFGFRYSDNINSGKWECFSVANNVSTLVDSAVLATTVRNTFRVFSYGAAGPLIFMVNDRTVASIGTNIPNVAGFFSISMFKVLGAAARTAIIDYAGFYYSRELN